MRTMGTQNSDVDESGTIKQGAPKEQLYDLAKDIAQSRNLAAEQPDKLKTLRERLSELTRRDKKAPRSPAE